MVNDPIIVAGHGSMIFAAMVETNRQEIDLKAKRFLDRGNHLSGPG